MTALSGVTGTVVTIRSRPVSLLRGRIDPVVSTASITDAAEICTGAAKLGDSPTRACADRAPEPLTIYHDTTEGDRR
jgi:citrate lyase alpha subunit